MINVSFRRSTGLIIALSFAGSIALTELTYIHVHLSPDTKTSFEILGILVDSIGKISPHSSSDDGTVANVEYLRIGLFGLYFAILVLSGFAVRTVVTKIKGNR